MVDAPSHSAIKDFECLADGDRAYLPTSKSKNGFYSEEEEFMQGIPVILESCEEPDWDELAAFWH